MTDLWDEVEDVVLDVTDATGRSVNPYSVPGPAHTGETYAEYFKRIRAQGQVTREREEDDTEYEITITQTAEEFDDPCSPLAGHVKNAHLGGWTLAQLGHSRAFAKGKPFKTGANEGTARPDQEIEVQWLYAQRGRDRVSVSYTLINGVVRVNLTARRLNGRAMPDRELKAYMKEVA